MSLDGSGGVRRPQLVHSAQLDAGTPSGCVITQFTHTRSDINNVFPNSTFEFYCSRTVLRSSQNGCSNFVFWSYNISVYWDGRSELHSYNFEHSKVFRKGYSSYFRLCWGCFIIIHPKSPCIRCENNVPRRSHYSGPTWWRLHKFRFTRRLKSFIYPRSLLWISMHLLWLLLLDLFEIKNTSPWILFVLISTCRTYV